MDHFLQTLSTSLLSVKEKLPLTAGLIASLFLIHFLNWMVGHRLNIFGIWPRKKWGWIGIPFSPFLHGNLAHLIFNALPLFIFSNLILLQGSKVFFSVSVDIIAIAGVLTWALGRQGIHIGASGLIMGYLGFILIGIYYKPSPLSWIVGVSCFYYFGGMLIHLFPAQDKRVSWEGHIFGFISGIATAYMI